MTTFISVVPIRKQQRSSMKICLVPRFLAVCIPLAPWRGPALVSFYLGAVSSACNESVRFKIVRPGGAPPSAEYVDLYSGHTFSLLERQGGG